MALTKINNNTLSSAGIATGDILQVVTATDSTNRSSTSTSFVTASNTLSVDITPSSTSNKVLIIISQSIGRTNTQSLLDLNLLRGATSLFNPWGNDVLYTAVTQHNSGYASINYLDSPSSTSSTTYKTQFRSYDTNGVYAQPSGSYSSITLIEIAG